MIGGKVYSLSDVSQKFRWLSFLACLGVVMIHNRCYLTMKDPSVGTVFIQRFGSDVIVRFSVPFFFVASGFWFAKRGYMGPDGVVGFVWKKVSSLIVPYLCWALVGALLLVPICGINNIVTHRPFFDRTVFAVSGTWKFIDALFGISGDGPIGDMPLWFIKSLTAIFLISPLFIFVRKLPALLLWIVGLALVVLGSFVPSVPWLSLSAAFVGWFTLGVALCESGRYQLALGWWKTVLLGFVWFVLSCVVIAQLMQYVTFPPLLHECLPTICNLVGVTFVWGVGDWLVGRQLPKAAGYLFWIYCSHQFVTSYLIATAFFAIGKNDVVAMFVYFGGPFVYVPICYWSARLFQRFFPQAYSVLAGGR